MDLQIQLSSYSKRAFTFVKQNPFRAILIVAIVISIALVIRDLFVVFARGYEWKRGTGFAGKTLWDWMELLIIPAVLAAGAYLFNRSERRNELKIAKDQQREVALKTYLDKMTELLVDKGLIRYEEVQHVARSLTLTVLRQLDSERKRYVIQFLDEPKLILTDNPIINLRLADLRYANLSGAGLQWVNFNKVDLSGADLREANLRAAMLVGARLIDADFRGADLLGADLSGADLTRAQVSEKQLRYTKSLIGAIMPDGTINDERGDQQWTGQHS